MRVLPVLDLRGGVVVRGVAGRRAEYQPIVSRLTSSSRPRDVALALHDVFGFREFYLADLDAIAGARPACDVYETIHALGCRLWVDAGVHVAREAVTLAGAGVARVVLGLETLAGPDELTQATALLGPGRVVFSLDLNSGQPLGDRAAWGNAGPEAVARAAVACGVTSMIVLDLTRVGVGGGTGTEPLCALLAEEFPALELVAGGGIRSMDDVRRLHQNGVQAVLVASALHDGRITAEETG